MHSESSHVFVLTLLVKDNFVQLQIDFLFSIVFFVITNPLFKLHLCLYRYSLVTLHFCTHTKQVLETE
jgi:hypothetical protein